MALQLTTSFHGVSVTNAYHKVSYVSGNKDSLSINMRVYKDLSESATPDNYIEEFSFKMVDTDMIHDNSASDKNYIKQAYEHLKAAAITDTTGVSRDYTSATDV